MDLSFETYEDFAFNVNGLLFLQIRSAVCAQKLSLNLYALNMMQSGSLVVTREECSIAIQRIYMEFCTQHEQFTH